MKILKIKSKPEVTEAIEVTSENIYDVALYVLGNTPASNIISFTYSGEKPIAFLIPVYGSSVTSYTVNIGNYIVKVNGSFIPVTKKQFEEKYEIV